MNIFTKINRTFLIEGWQPKPSKGSGANPPNQGSGSCIRYRIPVSDRKSKS